MNDKKRCRGFTLVELMIAVVIIGILTSVALPNYFEYIQRGLRMDCKEFMSSIAQAEERFYSDYGTYTTQLIGGAGCVGQACGLNYTDDMSSEGYCQVSIVPLPGSVIQRGYEIRGDILEADDVCDLLTYDSRGQKGNTGGASNRFCW